MNIVEIALEDTRYPALLRQIDDPPERLYCAGNISLLQSFGVSVVGSRKCTRYGQWAAETLSRELSCAGVTVVSGLAIGIDGSAHRGCLHAGGNTIAVMGCGLDVPYPWANHHLKEQILEQGLLISELKPGTQPAKYTFPRRNRIISGLSAACVVIEAGLNSGALITAEKAAEQGREIYVVPGNINSTASLGSNLLLYETDATPLVVFRHLLDNLHLQPCHPSQPVPLGSDEQKIWHVLAAGQEKTIDEISEETKIATAHVQGIISVLEIKGLVYTSLGKVFAAELPCTKT